MNICGCVYLCGNGVYVRWLYIYVYIFIYNLYFIFEFIYLYEYVYIDIFQYIWIYIIVFILIYIWIYMKLYGYKNEYIWDEQWLLLRIHGIFKAYHKYYWMYDNGLRLCVIMTLDLISWPIFILLYWLSLFSRMARLLCTGHNDMAMLK